MSRKRVFFLDSHDRRAGVNIGPPGAALIVRGSTHTQATGRRSGATQSTRSQTSSAAGPGDCFCRLGACESGNCLGDIPRPDQGRPRRRRGARFRGGLPAAAEVADGAPATALKPEGSCCATVRRCRDCPTAVAFSGGQGIRVVARLVTEQQHGRDLPPRAIKISCRTSPLAQPGRTGSGAHVQRPVRSCCWSSAPVVSPAAVLSLCSS